MEAWGRGIGLIMESCKRQGLPEPNISVVPPFINLTIWFKQSLNNTTDQQESRIFNKNTPSDTPSQKKDYSILTMLPPQDRIFEFCRSPKSISEIATMLGVKDKKMGQREICFPIFGNAIADDYPRQAEEPKSEIPNNNTKRMTSHVGSPRYY